MSVKSNDSTGCHRLASKISDTCSGVEMGQLPLEGGVSFLFSQPIAHCGSGHESVEAKLLQLSIFGSSMTRKTTANWTHSLACRACTASCLCWCGILSDLLFASWGPRREVERKKNGQFAMLAARQTPRWRTPTLAAARDGRCDRSQG